MFFAKICGNHYGRVLREVRRTAKRPENGCSVFFEKDLGDTCNAFRPPPPPPNERELPICALWHATGTTSELVGDQRSEPTDGQQIHSITTTAKNVPMDITQVMYGIDSEHHLSYVKPCHRLRNAIFKFRQQRQHIATDIVVHDEVLKARIPLKSRKPIAKSISELAQLL